MLRPVPSVVSDPTPVARLVRQATALCASAALLSPLAAMAAAPAAPDAPDEIATDAIPTVNITGKHDATTEKSKSFTTRSSTLFKGEQDIRDTPQPVTVITRQLMEERNMLDLTDVLTNTAGITVDYTDSERIAYNSRGFRVDAMQIDGLSYKQSGAYFIQPDTAVLDRVELLRGASGMLRGSGSPSATVNMVRKLPTAAFQASSGLTVGSWDRRRVEMDVSTPLNESGSVRGRVVAVKDKKDLFQDGREEDREVLYGVVQADLTPRTTVTAWLQHTDLDATGAWGGLPGNFDGSSLNLPIDTFLGASWNRWNRYNDQAQIGIEHRFDNGWSVRANAGYLGMRLKTNGFKQTYIARTSTTNPYLMDMTTSQYTGDDSRQQALSIVANGPFTLFGRKHTLVVGAERVYDRTIATYGAGTLFKQTIDIRTFDPYSTYPEREVTTMPAGGAAPTVTTNNGAYATARFSLADPLAVLLGARLSWYETERRTNGSGFKVTREATPYVGVVYDLSNEISAYASYTEIFEPQEARGADGNLLEPVIGEDIELGLKGEFFGGRLNASMGLFQVENVGRAIEDTSSVNPCPPTNLTGFCRIAGGKERSEGLEAEVSGEVLPGWQLMAGYTNTRTKYVSGTAANTGQPLRTIDPKHQLRLFTSYSPNRSGPGWTVGGGVNMQSDSYVRGAGLTATQGGYGVANAMLAWRFSDKLSVQANVNNLFDKVYYKKFGPTGLAWYYGDPRSVSLSLRGSL
ncbi:TonB-dependent siderophore receptor [Massilia sp. CFBP9012]|uniref:TonB-dependent siderophore receptor n=1 Tax=Massilia sp. CFBP9012 TaxID=3096531 RepID=UPI002A6A3A9E|nr:TonB-dependent siderophore receptor [Massilia sp. CFBP9012]MDY0977078.1 TonB-dependent siderophore receptor [Massilia sp. CFBP9012]